MDIKPGIMPHDSFIRSFRGPRDLQEMIKTASATRMLNLHQLWRDGLTDPDYKARPFFGHPILNRSILMKHNIRAGDELSASTKQPGATKLMLPLDIHDLTIGAQYLLVGQPNFTRQLVRSLDYANLPLERDLRLIQMLDRLPTLDPFLLQQMVLHYGFDIANCYFQMGQADVDTMAKFIVSEIEPLVGLCFGLPRSSSGHITKFANLIMSNQDNEHATTILRHGLRMTPSEFSQAIFAWKALLYYKSRMDNLAPQVRSTAMAMAQLLPDRKAGADMRRVFEKARGRITEAMIGAWNQSRNIVAEYESVYQEMVSGGRLGAFRAYLIRAPDLFISLGEQVGRLDQICRIWLDEIQPQCHALPVDDMCNLLLDLDATMAQRRPSTIATPASKGEPSTAASNIFRIAAPAEA